MRISLIDRLGIGNVGAVANAGQDAARRRLEDEAVDRLVAALSRHDGARAGEKYATRDRFSRPSQKAG